ncbi:MAG: ComEC/Rec2 family competence protein [Chloroflexi bacterium]|nr:ComEC/Rec2 family competence protein [Chloroflexota bacterium]
MAYLKLIWLTISWLCGIWLGDMAGWPWPALAAAGAGLLVAGLLAWRRGGGQGYALLLLAGAFFAFGCGRVAFANAQFQEYSLAPYLSDQPVTLRGTIDREPTPGVSTVSLRLRVTAVLQGREWQPVSTLVQVRVPLNYLQEELRYGDSLQVTGQAALPVDRPTLPVSYQDYLARQGISALIDYPQVRRLGGESGSPLQAWLYQVRQRALDGIQSLLPAAPAALLAGIALGLDRLLDPTVLAAFGITGTTHIIVISGANVAVVIAFLSQQVRRWWGARWVLPLTVIGLVGYTAFMGADPPVLRAVLTGSLALLALQLGREADALTSLAAASLAMTLWDPFLLWSVSFQMSFAATLGLVWFVPRWNARLEPWLKGLRWPPILQGLAGTVADSLVITLAAELAVGGIIAGTFGTVSLVGPLANLLIGPAQPYITLLGLPTALLALVHPYLALPLAWLVFLPLQFTLVVVQALAQIPGASLPLETLPAWGVPLYYAFLIAGAWAMARTTGSAGKVPEAEPPPSQAGGESPEPSAPQPPTGSAEDTFAVRIFGLMTSSRLLVLGGATVLLLWWATFSQPDGLLHVTFLDVGQGKAVLVSSPSGRQVLVDGGPSTSRLVTELGARLPFWQKRLDGLVLTLGDQEHLGGLPGLLARYQTGWVIDSVVTPSGSLQRQWQTQLAQANLRRVDPASGWEVDLGDDVWLQVAALPAARGKEAPPEREVRLVYGKHTFLLTGEFLSANTPLTVANLSTGVAGPDQLNSWPAGMPPWALVATGASPPANLLDAAASPVPLYRTETQGDVEFISDGQRLWIKTGR